MSGDRPSGELNQSWVVKPAPAEFFICHGPGSMEMRWGQLYAQGYLVPNERFYVHNRCHPPQVDIQTWRLQVSGSGVANSQSFAYADILGMPSVSIIRTMDCGANGRGFFPRLPPRDEGQWQPIAGTQWQLGGVGTAEWTGVHLRDLLDIAGLAGDARDVLVQSLDSIQYSHVIPLDKALADDTLLVYAMNGETLPIDHGYPLRLFCSGWGGNSNVKWVGGVEVSNQPIPLPNSQLQQVLVGPDYPEAIPVTAQNVKSAFELDWDATLAAGPYLLRGRSWSGTGTIVRVEVSLDGARTWQPARLREPFLPLSWVRWDLDWEARPGYYELMARATDDHGNTQPLEVPWNQYGLLYGGVVSHPVTVIAGKDRAMLP